MEQILSIDLIKFRMLSMLNVEELYNLKLVSTSLKEAVEDFTAYSRTFNFSKVFNGEKLFEEVIGTSRGRIRNLDLSLCSWLNDDLLILQLDRLANLENINLDAAANFSQIAMKNFVMGRDEKKKEKSHLGDAGLIKLAEQCDRLRVIGLRNRTTISDASLHSLARCRLLIRAHFDSCLAISDEGVRHLVANSTELSELSLRKCAKISERSLEAIGRWCGGLTSLDLEGCALIEDCGVEALAVGCPLLKKLNVRGCALLCGHFMDRLTCLEDLNATQCPKILDRTLAKILAQCENLKSVGIPFAGDPCVLIALQALEKLKRLELDEAHHLDLRYLVDVCRRNPDLSSLRLNFGLSMTRHQPYAELLHQLSNIRSLTIENCDVIGDLSLKAMARSCGRLESLSLTECPGASDASLGEVVRMCPNLSELSLVRCPLVTGRLLADSGDAKLTRLRLDRCTGLREYGSLAAPCGVRNLNWFSCRNTLLTKEALVEIVRRNQYLVYLDVSHSHNFDDEVLQKVVQNCKNLSHLRMEGIQNLSVESLRSLKRLKHLTDVCLLNATDLKEIATPPNAEKEFGPPLVKI